MGLISGRQEADKKWLMRFDPETDTATIDHAMPNWYAKLAILAEAAAEGMVRKRELDCLINSSSSKRVAAEKYCLTKTEKYRKIWLEARKYYYNFLLNQKPSEQSKAEYEEALRYIEDNLAKGDDVITEYLCTSDKAYETSYSLTSFEKFAKHENRKWLGYYATDGRVFLNETSPKWYRRLASLSEEVCMAEKYPELMEGYSWADNDHFDAAVEAMIIDKFTSRQTRKNYIEARIQMFTLIRDTKLNTVPAIQIALDYLIKRQKAEA
jgi:hypothetical protein